MKPYVPFSRSVLLGALVPVVFSAVVPVAMSQNSKVSRILSRFDINLDGVADNSPDSDGDGLPDSWEAAGADVANTDVPYPAPQAIVPGTPATPIFSRQQVRTSANARDSDGDGLTDFIEVFGLKFIDDNNNGVLDDACARNALGQVIDSNGVALFDVDGAFLAAGVPARLSFQRLSAGQQFALTGFDPVTELPIIESGEAVANRIRGGLTGDLIGEWFDFNSDGMPSIGEYPATNIVCLNCGSFENDFDGFVFTDPTNPDTDNDGVLDGFDFEPLINPRAFGTDSFSIDFGDRLDKDGDNDGLGNGMDLGNDDRSLSANRRGVLDNPSDLRRVLEQFRRDVLGSSSSSSGTRVPEALIDDLLGADWNGDGLFRLTDMREPRFGLTAEAADSPEFIVPGPAGNISLFELTPDVALGFAQTAFPTNHCPETYYHAAQRNGAGPALPLGLQSVLRPGRANETPFLPDPRIWTVLYAWRMPGFDVDGDGFIGYDTESFQGIVSINGEGFDSTNLSKDCANLGDAVVTPAALVAIADPTFEPTLNGQIEVPSSAGACGLLGLGFGSLATLIMLVGAKRRLAR